MLYKGYIKTKGKKAIEAFKDKKKYRTYDEVKDLDGFGGVLAEDTILIDIDDTEQSEILMNIVEELQLDCRVYQTSRGRHFLFKNHSITRNRTHVPLAVGLTADIKLGSRSSYEVIKINGEERFCEWDMLDESIRGAIPEGSDLFKQITVTFNPWNEHHWLKKRFFDSPDDETLAITTTYKCNEWLDKADLKVFETMKRQNPRRYAVAGLGGWGIVDGLVYENWHEEAFTLEQIRQQYSIDSAFGLDFGYGFETGTE